MTIWLILAACITVGAPGFLKDTVVANDDVAPLHWDVETGKGILWQVETDGLGFSTPVVAGDQVFITSVTPSRTAQFWRITFSWIGLGFLAILGILFIDNLQRDLAPDRFSWRGFILASAHGLVLVSTWVLLVYGDQALDFARCPIRRWLGTCFLILLVLCSALHFSRRSYWSSIEICFALFVLGGVMFLGVPARDHAFRTGLFQGPGLIVVASSVLPMVISGVALTMKLLPDTRNYASARRIVWASAIFIVTILGWLGLNSWADKENYGGHSSNMPSELLPWIPEQSRDLFAIAAGIAAIVFTLVVIVFRHRSAASDSQKSHALTYVLFLSFSTLMGNLTALLLDQIIRKLPYLNYHLGGAQWETELSTVAIVAPFVAVIGGGLTRRFLAITGNQTIHPLIPLSVAFTLLAVIAARWSQVDTSNYVRQVSSYSRDGGQLVWRWEGLEGPLGHIDKRNTGATSSPVASGDMVFADFGNAGLIALSFDGQMRWLRDDLPIQDLYGHASSLVVDGDVLLVSRKAPCLLALDCHTGTTIWFASSDAAQHVECLKRTPVVAPACGERQVLLWGYRELTAHSLGNGQVQWRLPLALGGDAVSSLVYQETTGRFFAAGVEGIVLIDVAFADVDDQGRSSCQAHVAWSSNGGRVNCTTPLIAGEFVFLLSDSGILTAVDAATGKRVSQLRLRGEFRSSPVMYEGTIYCSNLDGETYSVHWDDNRLKNVQQNRVHTESNAEIIPDGRGGFIIRDEGSLYRVGLTDGREASTS